MPIAPLRIPETPDYVGFAQKNAMLDFSPINDAITGWKKQQQLDIENRRADEQVGFQRTRLGMDQEKFGREAEDAKAHRFGKTMSALAQQPPEVVARVAPQLFARHPEYVAMFEQNGIPTNNPHAAVKMLAQAYGDFDPLKQEQTRAQIEASKANAAQSYAQAGNIGKTDSIREFQYAKQNGFTGTYQDWQTSQENRSTKYGLNPIPYHKPDGSIGYMVPSTTGQAKTLDIPGGGKALPKTSTIQMPTEAIVQDQFGNVIRREQKDIVGKESQEEIGKAKGQAVVNLPGVEVRAEMMNKALDAVEEAVKAAPRMTGYTGNLPNVTPTARDAQAKIDQVQGKVFLQAFDSLRGAGAITETEGLQAKAAISRLQATAVGTPQYIAAINDVRAELNALVGLAKKKTGGGAAPASGGGWSIQKVQ